MAKQYTKDQFKLVQEHEQLLDKALQSKQLTYFQDAMVRFTKNKYNVTATIILGIMILMSILIPIITPARFYEQTNSGLDVLPPRVPLLEKIGIFDGTTYIEDRVINYNTIDPETGIGYPDNEYIHPEYIFMDTLTNREIIGTVKQPEYRGGTNNIFVATNMTSYSIVTPEMVFLNGQSIVVDVESFTGDGTLKLYYSPTETGDTYTTWDDITFIGEITQTGETTFGATSAVADMTSGYLVLRYELSAAADDSLSNVKLNSVSTVYSSNSDVITEYSGYELSQFLLYAITDEENGTFVRENAVEIVASFKYDAYQALQADQTEIIGAEEYNQILADNPGMFAAKVDDPDDANHWTFVGDWPIREVTNVDVKIQNGIAYVNYTVVKEGLFALNLDNIPYFIFGTDAFGRDLFTLLWLGLRTSLLLGFLASIVNIIVGVIWGSISGYYGGQVDILMERFLDIWGSFPQITMIGIITVLIGPGFMALFIFIVYDGWIGAAKIARMQFYRYKGREYVLAARTLGASDSRIIFKHILPNALGTIVTRVVLSIPGVIFLEVTLSYLGFGIGNGQTLSIGPIELTGTSIGVILFDGQAKMFSGAYWLIVYPTLLVSILMITFNMFGNALRDALNPQLRGNS